MWEKVAGGTDIHHTLGVTAAVLIAVALVTSIAQNFSSK
jgi:hypothetical protein